MNDPYVPDTSRRLAEALGDLAIRMQSMQNSGDVLRAIIDAAVHIVPGASWAGVSRVRGRRVEAAVTTHGTVARLDELQTSLRQDPRSRRSRPSSRSGSTTSPPMNAGRGSPPPPWVSAYAAR